VSSEEILAQVTNEVSVCTKCALQYSRKKAVPGEGPATAEIMFIGEGPGFYENEQGRPFVGAAGQFLDQLLAQAGLKRAEVWIGNVVKCRPPGNRDPLPEELSACDAYLERQINAINPSMIVTLGRYSMSKFIPDAKISAVHGQMRRVGDRFVIPMFHPAAALHQVSLKPAIIADFEKLPELLKQSRAARGRSAGVAAAGSDDRRRDTLPDENPKQLNLF
jgi:uracil-DNA glycosylase family 4